VVLAIYCAGFVSTLDNFVKPWVLHGQANLHPLLALLSVIGGVQALGPIGILVGPMIVAFLQALLNMLNQELRLLGKDAEGLASPGKLLATAASESPAPASPAPVARHKKRKQQ
jgi:predicted PurR-regulated permease PerM